MLKMKAPYMPDHPVTAKPIAGSCGMATPPFPGATPLPGGCTTYKMGLLKIRLLVYNEGP